MVGYGREDEYFALGLTYTYGVESYEKVEGLSKFRIVLDNVAERSDLASSKGYAVTYGEKGVLHITGPDGYEWTLVPKAHGNSQFPKRTEPFSTVIMSTDDPDKLAAFYKSFVGMKELFLMSLDPLETMRVVGFHEHSVRFAIRTAEGAKNPKVTSWVGRHAIALPETTLRALNRRVVEEVAPLILHELRVLHEEPGSPEVLVLRDTANIEFAVFSSEAFHKAVVAATNHQHPDWERRKLLLDEHYFGAGGSKDEL